MYDIIDCLNSKWQTWVIAKNLGAILRAARKGKNQIRLENGGNHLSLPLDPLIFIGTQMPRFMFKHILSPTLIIHGSADLDVSFWNVASIEQSIRKNGISPERMILTGLDHWFRPVPKTPGDQLIERLNGKCFSRETDPQVFKESVAFIKRVMGTSTND